MAYAAQQAFLRYMLIEAICMVYGMHGMERTLFLELFHHEKKAVCMKFHVKS